TGNGRGGASRGGVDDHGTLEEGSPVTWGPLLVLGFLRGDGGPAPKPPTRRVYTGARPAGSEQAPVREVGRGKGNRSPGRCRRGVGGLHTSDDAGERGGNPDPAEQRQPVRSRTSGGKHEPGLDLDRHVPAT